MFKFQIHFFGGLEASSDVKNKGIEIHSASPHDGRFKVKYQSVCKQVLIDKFQRDALYDSYQYNVTGSNKKKIGRLINHSTM